jgi:hypothetical protein
MPHCILRRRASCHAILTHSMLRLQTKSAVDNLSQIVVSTLRLARRA